MKKILIIVGGIIGLLLISSFFSVKIPIQIPESAENFPFANAAAIVNGSKIEKEIFDAHMKQSLRVYDSEVSISDEDKKLQIKDSIINSLISQKLLEQAAIKSGTVITQKEVDAQFKGIKVQFEDSDEFYQSISAQGMTEEEFKQQIKADLLIQKYIEEKIESMVGAMTLEQLEELYQTNSVDKNSDLTEEEIREEIIQKNTQKFILELIEELKNTSQIEILI